MPSADYECPSEKRRLAEALELLRESQDLNRRLVREQQRQLRRIHRYVAGVLLTMLIAVVSVAMATGGPQLNAGESGSGSQGGSDREKLLAILGEKERARLEQFEARVQW